MSIIKEATQLVTEGKNSVIGITTGAVGAVTDTVKGIGSLLSGCTEYLNDELNTSVLETKAQNAVDKYRVIAKSIKEIEEINKELGITNMDAKQVFSELMKSTPYKDN